MNLGGPAQGNVSFPGWSQKIPNLHIWIEMMAPKSCKIFSINVQKQSACYSNWPCLWIFSDIWSQLGSGGWRHVMHICYSRKTLVLPSFPSARRSRHLCRSLKHCSAESVRKCTCKYIWVTIDIFGVINRMGITVIKPPDWTRSSRKENTKWVFRLLGRPRQSEWPMKVKHNYQC